MIEIFKGYFYIEWDKNFKDSRAIVQDFDKVMHEKSPKKAINIV